MLPIEINAQRMKNLDIKEALDFYQQVEKGYLNRMRGISGLDGELKKKIARDMDMWRTEFIKFIKNGGFNYMKNFGDLSEAFKFYDKLRGLFPKDEKILRTEFIKAATKYNPWEVDDADFQIWKSHDKELQEFLDGLPEPSGEMFRKAVSSGRIVLVEHAIEKWN